MRRTHRARIHSRNVLAIASLAAGVSGSALHLPAPQAAMRVAAPAVPEPVELSPTIATLAAPVTERVEPAAPVVAEVAPQPEPVPAVVAVVPPAAARSAVSKGTRPHYEQLRAQLRWVPVRVAGREFMTPDADSRLLLVRSAAERAGLAEVGLDFRDVYGVINAETTWVARTGMGRNGVASHGLAQFEPATARALGVRDANDPVEAVHGAATLLKEAANWSARRIAGLGLSGPAYAARLREGVSIYYNLSSRARERWNGVATAGLPVETQRHIRNVRAGARLADELHRGAADPEALVAQATAAVRSAPAEESPRAVRRVAAAQPSRPAAPKPLGTIAWSGSDRSGSHVVWSDGRVTRERDGRVRWSSATPG